VACCKDLEWQAARKFKWNAVRKLEWQAARKFKWHAVKKLVWQAARKLSGMLKRSQVAITELLLFRKSTGVILRDALPALQRLCANRPFEDCQSANVCEAPRIAKCECLRSRANCQVRMFVKQPNIRLQQLLAVENKTILQQLKPSTLYMMFQLTLIFYPHHTGMRSQMLYTNGSFKICQERMFVKQR